MSQSEQNKKKEIPSELEEIQDSIKKKEYENAIEKNISFLNKSLENRREIHISFALEIMKAICDKSEETIDQTLGIIQNLMNHEEYWVRENSLMILQKVYNVEPERLEHIIEKIESKLFDADKNVRIAAIKVISHILKDDLERYPHLYITYSRMFEDHSWTVRATALEYALLFLTKDTNPSDDMIAAFTENIFDLFRDPDEEVRGLTAEFFKALSFHLEERRIIELLDPIVKDVDWEIREKGVWIIGEIGSLYFDKLKPLFLHLIQLFEDENLMIQTKAIDSFAKIGDDKCEELLELFIPQIEEGKKDINQGIAESIIFITLNNPKQMIPKIIKNLNNPQQKVREIIKDILLKIYMEMPDSIEEEIYSLLQTADKVDWRERKKIAHLLGDLNYILKIQSIAVWSTINLKNWKEYEKDYDVIDEIENSLEKIYNVFENLDEKIEVLQKDKEFFYQKMNDLRDEPRKLRNKIDKLITENNFNDAEIALEEETREIMKKLDNLENELNESEFRRCSIQIFQDFKDAKDEIMEHISDVKSVMFNKIYDERSSYLEELREVKQNLQKRIDVLENQYQSVKDMEIELDEVLEDNEEDKVEEFIDTISTLRRKINKLEYEIGQTWIKNLDFKDFLKSLTIYWIDTKLEIQKYLADIFYKFKKFRATTQGDKDKSEIKERITFEFLNQQFQNTVVQAIQGQQEYLRQFDKVTKPIEDEIKKHNFKRAKNRLKATENNIYSIIENNNREISNFYNEIEDLNMPISSANDIREELQNWNDIKDKVLNRIRNFKNQILEEILYQEVKEFLSYMNPIPLESLAKYLNYDMGELKDKLFKFIKEQKIQAKIQDSNLIQPEKPMEEKILSIFRKVEIIGSKLSFSIRIYNPTKYFIKDLELTFIYPEILELIPDLSDSLRISIREFEPEASRIINWNFKILKDIEKKYDVQKFLMNLSYKNPFNRRIDNQKEMEMII